MSEDGDLNETLQVESPEDPSLDPSLSNDQQETQLEEILDRMVSASGAAVSVQMPNEATDPTAGGSPGSSDGTSASPYGSGGGVRSGIPRATRWTVEFTDQGSLTHYAQQLDFFGIELGVVYENGRVVYVSQLSSGFSIREGRTDGGDNRLFMSWQQGDRVKADLKLLKDAGVTDAASGRVVHFYPPETEDLMARLERDYAGRPSEQIRRTRFRATGEPGAFEFVVESQKYR